MAYQKKCYTYNMIFDSIKNASIIKIYIITSYYQLYIILPFIYHLLYNNYHIMIKHQKSFTIYNKFSVVKH